MRLVSLVPAAALVMPLGSVALAADLSYEPGGIAVTLEPGESVDVQMTVGIHNSGYSTYYMWFIDQITGDVPAGWVHSSRTWTFLSSFWSTGTTTLTISVPEDAASGVYEGTLFSKAMRSHGFANAGDGVALEITVASACADVPSFTLTEIAPESLWPPNHGIANVGVSGQVTVPSGCSLLEVGWWVEDEYGVYTDTGTFDVSLDGDFDAYIPVEASRLGQDKDGRYYDVWLYAVNEAGELEIGPFQTHVPHDRRKGSR